MSTESGLHLHGLKAGVDVGTDEVSASGPGAEAPAVAGKDFERIWRTYGKLGNKAASRRAFDALTNPDVDHIAERAAAWAASAKPGQRRMPLEKWLEQERYDEADRNVRQSTVAALEEGPEQEDGDVRRKRDSVDPAEAAEAARAIYRAAIEIGVKRNVPLTVLDSTIEKRGNDKWLCMETDKGDVAIVLESTSFVLQEEGQAHLGRLANSCGTEIEESADLHGRTFMIVGDTFATAQRAV